MDVHHHPQLEHKPKPWKEYFLEFLMIFLAVTMGFIAENIRENISDHEHVKQLTSQLLQDLKTDTANMQSLYVKQTALINKDDTLINLLDQPLATIDRKKLQDLVLYCYTIDEFHPTVGAIGAIKNEAHLKQIANSKLINNIADYELAISITQKTQDLQYQNLREYLQTFFARHFTAHNLDARAFKHQAVSNVQLRNINQNDLDQLAAEVEIIKITNSYEQYANRTMKEKAVKLMQYIIKQYNLGGNE